MADNLSLEDLQKLKVADLKKELKQRGLSQAGNKTELIERLQLAYAQGSPSLDNEELLDDDEDDLADESLEDDLAAIKDEESEHIVLGSKRKLPAPAPTASLPLKKVVLNRTAVAAAIEKENLEEGDVPATTATTAADETAVKKGGAKITSLTAQERLELRASKFGVPMSADAQKAARAARFGITATTTTTTGAAPANVDALKKRAERFGGSVSSTLTKVELDEKLKKRQERFGVVEPASNGKAKTTVKATTTITSSSTSVKVPITLGNSAVDDKKKSRAERFKATL